MCTFFSSWGLFFSLLLKSAFCFIFMPMALATTSLVVCLTIQYSSWEIYKVLSSFPILSTILLFIGAPSKQFCQHRAAEAHHPRLVCDMEQDAVGRQQNIIKSFSFKSKYLQRFFFFFLLLCHPHLSPPSSLQFPACVTQGSVAQQANSHLTLWGSDLNSKTCFFPVWQTNK